MKSNVNLQKELYKIVIGVEQSVAYKQYVNGNVAEYQNICNNIQERVEMKLFYLNCKQNKYVTSVDKYTNYLIDYIFKNIERV